MRTGGQWKPINVSQGQRHLFIRAGGHCMLLFNQKKNGATHEDVGGKKLFMSVIYVGPV